MALISPNSITAEGNLVPRGYFQILDLSSALSLPGTGRICWLIPETQAIRIRDDGEDPTDTIGFLIPAGMCFKYTGNPRAIRVIEAAASAVLNILSYD